MKIKNTAVLIVLLVGLLPVSPVTAQSPAEGSLNESASLAFASHSILLNEVDAEDDSQISDAVQEASQTNAVDGKEALGYLIHATKQQRNELNDSCRQLRAAYRAEGKTCELQILNDYCKAEEAKLNQRIGFLHKLRGDRRKFFTRVWHSLKRTGTRIWTAVGPVGRRILRNVGPEAAKIVLSGGSLSEGVIRKLVIKEARSVGKAEMNRLLERGLGRFLQGQAALAQAAGITDCTAEKMKEARQQVAGDVGEPEMQAQSDQGESCETNWLYLGYWEENILPELQESDKRCGDFYPYQACLAERANQGDCPDEAIANCESVYEEILSTNSGKVIKIVDDQLYVRDDDNHFDITFSLSAGGQASGSVLIEYVTDYGGGDYCQTTLEKHFTGTLDPTTCLLSGTLTATQSFKENREGVCYWGEPYQRSENWSMIISRGSLGPGGPYNQLVGETYPLENHVK